jgi:Flp pilus assembly protein TadG
LRKFLQRFRRADSGQALLEFALFASVFVLFFIGVTDVTFYILGSMIVQEAATEGANYGAAWGNQNDNTGMVSWASQAASGIVLASTPTSTTFYTCSPGGATVSSTTTCSGSPNLQYVKVTATATVNPVFSSKYFGSKTITSTVTYRVAHKTQ